MAHSTFGKNLKKIVRWIYPLPRLFIITYGEFVLMTVRAVNRARYIYQTHYLYLMDFWTQFECILAMNAIGNKDRGHKEGERNIYIYVVAFCNSNLWRVLNTTLPFSKLKNFVNCTVRWLQFNEFNLFTREKTIIVIITLGGKNNIKISLRRAFKSRFADLYYYSLLNNWSRGG